MPLLALLASPTGAARAGGAEDFVRRLFEVDTADAARLERAAGELAALPGAAAALLEIRATGLVASATDGPAARPTPEQERLLELAAPRLDAAALIGAVQLGTTEPTTPAWRLAALELLRWHASAFDVQLLAELVHDPDGVVAEESPQLDAFRTAMVELLRRDPRALSELDWLRYEPVPIRLALVRAVGRSTDPESVYWLGQELADPDLAPAALQELGRARRGTPLELPLSVAERVRTFLFSTDASQRRHAVRAVVALGDELAIPSLVLLLDEGAGSDRRGAHEALRALTDRNLPARAGDWQVWYESELEWLHTKGQATLEQLGSSSDAGVVAAIRTISERGLWRDRIALELLEVLSEHASPAVRGQACLGLARLGSGLALQGLVDALSDPDPGVQTRAHSALRTLTGRDAAPDPELWEAVLSG